MIKEIMAEIESYKLQSDYLVVGIDDFELVGDKLYPIKSFKDLNSAKEFVKTRKDNVFIINPKTESKGHYIEDKHKYKRKWRNNKGEWVYEYDDNKQKDKQKVEMSEVTSIDDLVDNDSFKDYIVGVVNDLRNMFKDFSFSAGSVEGFLKEYLLLKHKKMLSKPTGTGGGSGKQGGSRGSSGGKSKLDALLDKYGFGDLSKEQKQFLLGLGNEMYNDLVVSPKNPLQNLSNKLKTYLGDMSMQDITQSFTVTRRGFLTKYDITSDDRWYIFTDAFMDAKKDELKKDIKEMVTIFTYDTTYEVKDKSRQTASLLGNLGGYFTQENKEKLALKLFDILEKDVINTNKALKYMGLKERVKKDGLRTPPKPRQKVTKTEIEKNLTTSFHDRYKLKTSDAFLKSSDIKNRAELDKHIQIALDKIPKSVYHTIAYDDTNIHFVTRQEAKMLRDKYRADGNNVLGFYTRMTKDVYIYPPKEGGKWTFRADKNEKFKSDLQKEGYDIKTFILRESEVFEHTIVHEVGHSVALNMSGEMQIKWNKTIRSEAINKGHSLVDGSYVSNYATYNAEEDFAETFAFYAKYKSTIDNVLKSPKLRGGLDEVMRIKLRFMRDEVWK